VTRPVGPRVPLATYRLQLGSRLTFDDAAGLVPYLAALGISDCYISPFFEASSESSHGYDVSDHNAIRGELGGEEAFVRFSETLDHRGLGLLIDLVPNHMGIARNRNPWWRDVLENGPRSRYAHVFDIDWKPAKRELAGKVLLPVLGDQYGIVLERGDLKLELNDGIFTVRYYDTTLPIAPHSYRRILGHRIEELEADLGPAHPGLLELKALTTWFASFPPRPDHNLDRPKTRDQDKTFGVERLAALVCQAAEVRTFLDGTLRHLNGTPGDPRSFDLLDQLLSEQAYRLAFWRVAGEEINYRRFFDINELAAIRMEDPEVFAETHRLVLRLVGAGRVTGLRVDHPDGLYAPAEYFRRLQHECVRATAPDGGAGLYIVAEKILSPGEALPRNWAIAGTTGYEFLNLLNGIFVDRSQARAMEHLYARLIKERPSFSEVVYECKRLILQISMASELNMLAQRLNAISEEHRTCRDFTLASLTRALVEIIANFPVYRTYVGEDQPAVNDSDREFIARAVAQAKRRTPLTSPSIYDWIQDILTLRFPPRAHEAERRELEFVMRFQQITSPVTAKGYEDTALYRFNRLVSLNEVGADPSRYGIPLAVFHAAMADRQRSYPHGLSATSTHDTKRGEDVRARINVLSEIPGEWRRRVALWQKLNRKHRTMVDSRPTPGANTEYLIYQTLIGAWPISVERLRAYLSKAIHETKSHTSWINPNVRYDDAIARFAEAILDPARSSPFLEDFAVFQAWVAHFGVFNSLAQTLVKITAPGVPDFYQGSELWDLNLVDPDNRRPVDWQLRRDMLDELTGAMEQVSDRAAFARELMKAKEDGRAKLYLIREALACRRAYAPLFREGEYRPLEAQGTLAEHILGFARVAKEAVALTIVPRLLARRGIEELPLGETYWGDETRLLVPPEVGPRLVNRLTGERLAVDRGALSLADVFASFPVALLVQQEEAAATHIEA
jgi:(1->4)-alpha-D-glucan 1-alpha-D-glucosylmutase